MKRLGVFLMMLTLLAGCGDDTTSVLPIDLAGASGKWQRIADLPLSPRAPGALVATDSEVFVIGGDSSSPCPPNADCDLPDESESDGAALNVETGTWRAIASAPAQIPESSVSAFVDGHILVCTHRWHPKPITRLLDYNVTDDAWTERSIPKDTPCQPIADGNRVVFFSGTDENGVLPDRVLDLDSDNWSTLPEDPLGPAYDRVIVSTPHGLFLSAKDLVRNPGAAEPSLTLFALLDPETNTWKQLPDTGQIGGWQWTWTGRHLLAPELGEADGGEGSNWGRSYPYGGTIDVPSGAWSPLADAPDDYGRTRIVGALGVRYSNVGGYLYDDEDESWTTLPEPVGVPEYPGAPIWADDQLIIIGGTDWDDNDGTRSEGVWQFTP